MLDAKQTYQISVAACLRDDTHARVYQNDSQVSSRTARYHVSCVLLVSWRISNNELTVVGTEIAISDIDCNAFLSLGFQSVEQ